MHFDLDDTQKILQAEARRFASERLRPQAMERDASGAFPADVIRELAQLGFMGVNIPAELGGSEAGVVSYSLAVTEIARGDASVAVTMCVNNMVGEVIAHFGTPAQREKYVPKLTSGEYLAGSFCLSEPGSGSDAKAMKTRAEKTEDGWTITGSKAWITSGTHAGVYIVWAKTRMDDGNDRVSAFLVEAGVPGLEIGKPEKKMGQKASDTVPVTLDGVKVGDDALLGELGGGFKIAMMALDGGRVGIGSLALGLADEALALGAGYASERKQFGKPLTHMQATQFKLADMATEIEAARMLVLRAAWLKEQGDRPFSKEASMAKLYCSEMAGRVVDEAVQLHGGYGYTSEYDVERLYRDARVTRIYEGTSEIQRIVIARQVISELG